MRRALCSVLFLAAGLTACSTSATKTSGGSDTISAPAAPSSEPTEPVSIRGRFPRNKPQQSAGLFQALEKSGLPSNKSKDLIVLRAYEVTCSLKPDSDQISCSLHDRSKNQKGARTFSVPAAQAQDFAALLYDLPIPQGDSGAFTPFIECSAPAKNKASASCYVAIDLDYQGP